MVQGDLFQIPQKSMKDAHDGTPSPTAFLERYRISLRLDQCLILAIIFMVLYVWTFSLGVERGRRWIAADLRQIPETIHPQQETRFPHGMTAKENLPAFPEVADRTAASEVTTVTDAGNVTVSASVQDRRLGEQPPGKYTIQIVTYLTQEAANRKIKDLKTRGYEGFIIPSGKFFQICVNGFESRQNASLLLKDLQGRGIAPKDAYVRPIPS